MSDTQDLTFTRTRILALIDSEYKNDTAFERAMALSPKTVSNWRRGRSASFMNMLPRLAEGFGVTVGFLLGTPSGEDTSELSEEEWHLVHLYRRARMLPKPMRTALAETLAQVVKLYLGAQDERA